MVAPKRGRGLSAPSPKPLTNTPIAFFPSNQAVCTTVLLPLCVLWGSKKHRPTIEKMRALLASRDRVGCELIMSQFSFGTLSSCNLDCPSDPRDRDNPNTKRKIGDLQCAAKHTGLVIPGVNFVGDVAGLCIQLAKWDYIVADWLSPSGQGVEALVQLTQVPDASQHKVVFTQICAAMEVAVGVGVNKTGANAGRMCSVSWDSEIIVANNPVTWGYLVGNHGGALRGADRKRINDCDDPARDLAEYCVDNSSTSEIQICVINPYRK